MDSPRSMLGLIAVICSVCLLFFSFAYIVFRTKLEFRKIGRKAGISFLILLGILCFSQIYVIILLVSYIYAPELGIGFQGRAIINLIVSLSAYFCWHIMVLNQQGKIEDENIITR